LGEPAREDLHALERGSLLREVGLEKRRRLPLAEHCRQRHQTSVRGDLVRLRTRCRSGQEDVLHDAVRALSLHKLSCSALIPSMPGQCSPPGFSSRDEKTLLQILDLP
jgi:hypothetical protein